MEKRSAPKGVFEKLPTPERTNQFRISVAGMGYVGLATALCFALAGHRVHGVEIDLEKCKTIQGGKSPIHEQGIDSALEECLRKASISIVSAAPRATSTCATGESLIELSITVTSFILE